MGDDKRHLIVALGRLGWSLRRIEQATGVRRETISGYLKPAGIDGTKFPMPFPNILRQEWPRFIRMSLKNVTQTRLAE